MEKETKWERFQRHFNPGTNHEFTLYPSTIQLPSHYHPTIQPLFNAIQIGSMLYQQIPSVGVIIGFGASIYAMKNMVTASRTNNAAAFQKAQRLRMVASLGTSFESGFHALISLGAVVSLVVGYVYKNQDR